MAKVKNTTASTVDVTFRRTEGGPLERCKIAPDATSEDIPEALADQLAGIGCTPIEGETMRDRLNAAKEANKAAGAALKDAQKAHADALKANEKPKPGDEAAAAGAIKAAEERVARAKADVEESEKAVAALSGK